MIFCDTSTLAKYYGHEKGSAAVVARLGAEHEVMASELARIEIAGVFHRWLREKIWSRGDFSARVRQFAQDDAAGYWSWAPLDRGILEQGAKIYLTLPDTVFLRTADCLHLVTAIQHGFGEIHTHDLRQAKAALALGLKATAIA